MEKTDKERIMGLEVRMDNSEKLLNTMNSKLDALLTSKSLVVGFLAALALVFQGITEFIKHMWEVLTK